MKRILLLLCLSLNFQLSAQDYQFLGGYDAHGVPDYMEPENDIISDKSMQMLLDALPESYPVPEYNPHYITAGYDTDIALQKDASIWVTFVKEGAGYKNVLGFYTYQLNNSAPAKPTPSDITIIFPNVSEEGSGGGLRKGNRVKIGDFPAGTGIGWVLLANGWNGSGVTGGHWQVFSNPDFNPEANEELKHHMVLLSDPDNERVYLGIEDIRRDYASCDQDFNDALFFVTANPYEAIKTYNYADIKSATKVSSANKGGLESNGDLASLIARRNFGRLKNNYSKYRKEKQQKFAEKAAIVKSPNGLDLASLLPQHAMFGNEEARISSPEDLMGITNAQAIFSADYYIKDQRIAAALITKTSGGVYDHSKAICDRLNSSSLEDIRTIILKGHELVMMKILRAGGQLEYAVSFSVETGELPILHSYWNIADYPEGDYVNFQVWGNSMGQVSSIAGHILEKFEAYSSVISEKMAGRYPTVFVKRGFYKDGRLHLVVKNKNEDEGFLLSGKIRATEFDEEVEFISAQNLNQEYEEEITITSGNLFDAGIELWGDNSPQPDALYLADGPWGVDYDEEETQIEVFNIKSDAEKKYAEDYRLERNVKLEGKIFGTANLFRTILPGEQAFDASRFEALEFNIQNTSPVEVILVTEEMQSWEGRYRLQLDSYEEMRTLNLRLSDFSNGIKNFDNESLKAIVFSVQGDYSSFKNFSLSVEKIAFTDYRLPKEHLTGGGQENIVASAKAYNYPNPFKDNTTIVIPREAKTAQLYIYDRNGRRLWSKRYEAANFKKQLPLQLPGIKSGIYQAVLLLDEKEKFSLSLLVN